MTDEIIKHLQTMGDQIKFSKGFMSRSSHVLIALFSLGAIVIWKGDPLAYALWSVSFLGYFFWYFFTLDFAKKHADVAEPLKTVGMRSHGRRIGKTLTISGRYLIVRMLWEMTAMYLISKGTNTD